MAEWFQLTSLQIDRDWNADFFVAKVLKTCCLSKLSAGSALFSFLFKTYLDPDFNHLPLVNYLGIEIWNKTQYQLCKRLAWPIIPHFWSGLKKSITYGQGGITCGAIDEPRKSSKAIDQRVIINFRDKNVVIARFRDKNVYRFSVLSKAFLFYP